MERSGKAMAKNQKLTHDRAQQYFIDCLRAHAGLGKDMSVVELADKMGVKERTVRAHLSGQSIPDMHYTLLYCEALGPGFANQLFISIGMTGLHEIDGPVLTPHELLAELCKHPADLAEYLSDGVFDHRERREFAQSLPRLIAVLANVNQELQTGVIRMAAAE